MKVAAVVLQYLFELNYGAYNFGHPVSRHQFIKKKYVLLNRFVYLFHFILSNRRFLIYN